MRPARVFSGSAIPIMVSAFVSPAKKMKAAVAKAVRSRFLIAFFPI